MKKYISILIAVLVVMASVSGLAEDFSIHSGVSNGMTREEVINLETAAGFEVEESEDYITVKGKIASIENSAIRYYFEDDSLTTACVARLFVRPL